jgi:hypothetical protein
MLACMAAPIIAAAIAFGATPFAVPAGNRLPFHRVVGQIWREGLGLMLQGVGLSGLTAFASRPSTACRTSSRSTSWRPICRRH